MCTDALFIEMDEIRALTVDWCGAWIVPRAELEARAFEAVTDKLGSAGDGWDAYHAVEDAIGLLRNCLEMRGSGSYSTCSDGSLIWLNEARAILCPEEESGSTSERVRDAGLIDGVYFDPDELMTLGGLLFPLRTEVQRWLCDIFATIITASGNLERRGKGNATYWVSTNGVPFVNVLIRLVQSKQELGRSEGG